GGQSGTATASFGIRVPDVMELQQPVNESNAMRKTSSAVVGTALTAIVLGLGMPRTQAQSVELINYTTTTWRYTTNAPDQGTCCGATPFTDPAPPPWYAGRGVFGYEPGNPQNSLPGFNTVFTAYPPTPAAPPGIYTYYFRTHFNVTSPASVLTATCLVDDGLV